MISIKTHSAFKPLLSFITIVLAMSAFIFFSDKMNFFVISGLKFSFLSIIGSVFPAMIISDLIFSNLTVERPKFPRRLFSSMFKINGYALTAFIVGAVCGFPMGVKVSAELYKNGIITKDECERLIGFTNNTGPAFLISGIGLGIRGCIFDGVILYSAMLVSSVLTGILFGIGKAPSDSKYICSGFRFNFSESVRSAAVGTLYITAFITAFSVICGLIGNFIPCGSVLAFISSFLEVGNASKIIGEEIKDKGISLVLTAFAVCFSGMSVHAQSKCFLPEGISMKTYFKEKILCGFFASLLTAFYSFLR